MSIDLAPHSSLPPSLSSTSCYYRRVDLRLASKSTGTAHALLGENKDSRSLKRSLHKER